MRQLMQWVPLMLISIISISAKINMIISGIIIIISIISSIGINQINTIKHLSRACTHECSAHLSMKSVVTIHDPAGARRCMTTPCAMHDAAAAACAGEDDGSTHLRVGHTEPFPSCPGRLLPCDCTCHRSAGSGTENDIASITITNMMQIKYLH